MGPNVHVELPPGQTLTDDGTLSFASGDTVTLDGNCCSSAEILVAGTMTAAGTTFNGTDGGGSIAVNSGGQLTATSSTFSLNQLAVQSGSTANLQFVTFATQLAINSGATINIHNDDFSSANATVVASGSSTATIDLTNNFWGTLNTTQIAAKITDHTKNSSLPTVLYQPFLTENATATYAANASVIYSPNVQTVTLGATVISADGPVTGGTETFTIKSGSNVIGTPVTSNVASGAASGTYTIPAGALGGVYTIQAVFSGTSTLSGSSDSTHTLTISAAATTTAAKSATANFSASNQTISLSATVTSSAGIVNEGTETFTILSGMTPVGTPATAGVSNGAVTASYTLPGGTIVGTYTIEAVYNGTADYATSTDTSHSLTIIAPATILWNTTTAPTGGDWDTPSNWIGGAVPTAASNVVINLTGSGTVTHSTGANDAALSLTTNGNTSLSIGSGSIALGNRGSSIGSVTIGSGATLSAAAGASVTIQANVTVSDNGTLSFASGDALVINNGYGSASQIVVGGGGLLTASNTTFSNAGSYYNSHIEVASNGRLQASGSTFALNQLYLDNGSLLNPGDLVGNAFDLPLFLPAAEVQNLSGTGSNNLRFQDINISSGTLTTGQTLALNAIGTATTANLRYVFPGNFTIASGATVAVAANTNVLIQPNVTVSDNGTLSFASGDALVINNGYGSASQIVVGGGGLLTASNTTFSNAGSYYNSHIEVASNGRLQASGSTFALNQLYLDNGSLLNPGDLVGNAFDLPLFLPAAEVQNLSGTGSNNLRFQDINISSGTLTTGQTLALNAIGTATTANLRYVFPGNFTIASAATVAVAANTNVLIQPNVTVSDNGTLSFASGDALVINNGYGSASQIVVGGGGLLTASNTTFSNAGSYYNSHIEVASNGRLQASGSTFALNQLYLDNGSLLNPGDLVGNAFDLPLFLPAAEVQNLSGTGSNNLRFQDINISSGTLTTGQTLALNAIGTATTANLRYVFPGNFTIASGATVAVAANTNVLIQPNVTVSDNGTLSFASGDALVINNGYGSASQIVVGGGGLLTASNTTFSNAGSYYNSHIEVASNGRLQASGSTFALNQLYLDNGSLLNPGDLVGNAFDLPLFLPAAEVQNLSGTGSNNLRFQDINISSGTLTTGQTLALNAIGTATTANLRYVFPGNFTIASGATVAVAANTNVLIQPNVTVSDNGTLSFASGDALVINNGYGSASQIVVGGGGLLTASNTTFSNAGSYYNSHIEVASNGRLQASGSTFALNQLYLDNGSLLNPGDLVGNAFDLPLFLPAPEVQNLSGTGSNNLRFQDINISSGTLTTGQTLALNAIGTATTANLRYVFPGNFTIASGATVAVAANTNVLIQPNVTVSDNGTLSFASGDALVINNGYGSASQIVVGGGGLLTASNTTFSNAGSYYNSHIEVASNGRLQASGSTFALNQLYLDNGSTDTLQFVTFATQLAINSGASNNIHNDDFSSASATVVASGGSTTTIDLTNNFWGTLNTTQIAAKITDHTKNSSLPTVLYQPFLGENATGVTAANAAVSFSTASQSVALSATVISAAGLVNTGTATFSVLNGSAVVGTPVVSNVMNGVANAEYALPASTPGGIYTIQVVFSGTSSLLGSNDSSHSLTINNVSTSTAAASAATTFSVSEQTVALQRHGHERDRHRERGTRNVHDSERKHGNRFSRQRERDRWSRKCQLCSSRRHDNRNVHDSGGLRWDCGLRQLNG